MCWHSQTSLEVSTRHRFCCRPPKIATTLGTQKLGNHDTKSNDPEHLDAFTDADWSGDSINRKEYFGWNTQDRFSNVERVHEGSKVVQTLSSEESEYCAAVTTTTAQALHPPTTSGILGIAGAAPIENRFDIGSRHHPEDRVRTSQAH